jgi:hypothetical protein
MTNTQYFEYTYLYRKVSKQGPRETSDYIVIRVENDPIKSPALNKIFTFAHPTKFYNNTNTRILTHLSHKNIQSLAFFSLYLSPITEKQEGIEKCCLQMKITNC